MMLGAVLGYTFAVTLGWPLPLAAIAALAALRAVRRSSSSAPLVRPFAERGSNAWLMATVAGGIVLDNLVLFTFGKEPRGFPSVLATKPVADRSAPASIRCSSSSRSSGSRSRSLLQLAFSPHPPAARPCSRWCRTPTPRG